MVWLPLFWLGQTFDWLQVEVTTACTAACGYCPRTVFRERWQERFLSRETFARLLSHFPRARHVHLQGWGEPLLHPDFFLFAQQAKAAGCRVGVTTNGMLLDEEKIQRFLDLQVDVLAFSLAGADPGQDRVRQGTRFAVVLAAMAALQRAKTRRGSAKPAVHVAYMLLNSRLGDLPRLPRVLAGLGVEQVVLSTLDYVAAPALAAEVVRPASAALWAEVAALLESTAREAGELGLALHHRLGPPGAGGRRCRENPERALVVAADGGVFPCVFTNLPAAAPPRGQAPARLLPFGNVNEADLLDLWQAPAYRTFRQAHSRGLPPALCRGCPKLS